MFSIRNKKNFYKKPTFLYLTKYAIKSLEKGVSPKYLVIKKKSRYIIKISYNNLIYNT